MRVLVDTHVLLWWLADDDTLSERVRAILSAPETVRYVSSVSILEMRVKQAIGKLELPADFMAVLAIQPFAHLAFTVDHADAVSRLPLHHRDPFDRALLAQAMTENLVLLSQDRDMARYDVALIG
jgi:PIN domain nuclease of toxin-antitoxin system